MNYCKKIFQKITSHPYILVGGVLVFIAVFAAIAAPILTSFDPLEVSSKLRLLPPSGTHFMGTDEYGRDIMSRVLYGAQNSILIGLSVVLLTTVIGGLVGLVSGFFTKIDNIIMRILDGLMAFPSIIIAISLAAILGSGKFNIIMALSFAYFPRMARVVRGSTITIKELEYVESARAVGAKNSYTIFKHVLPNCFSPIIVQATFIFAMAILDEAALSFLGVGIKAPEPSWGGMISEGRSLMTVAPWGVLFPGGAIALTVIGLNLLGDGLRDILDPRLKI